MSNVIQFPKAKPKVHILKFKCPAVLKMTKEADNDITMEIERVSPSEGIGTAWVPAVNETEAKQKLHKLIQVKEWIT
tara:strand:+ start:66 stop:296 length:231 start_codon:yes stop_codon:yes gene_type:complete